MPNKYKIPLRPLETNLDNDLSRSKESIYSAQTFLESLNDDRGCCERCLTRIPYATLIATIMCALGVVIFCGTMFRGATLAVLMFSEVFSMQLFWVDAVKMTFVLIGACMGALGLMILTVGFLATGATRHKVYRGWGSRVSGRLSCATVHYLMCLSANYAHIRDQEKFLQFQDLQMLSDNDMLAGKDRF
ncbi:hypothetical protein NQ314_001173 [Rhamnusium bicolor]|uniref:Uncharacterized protein n=1 Tax=Rhamnusium bicolor TaxID=1586634 RepID=A0AAV8ZTH8_9CUCU|nr:hypothetical protein NQ314_001173 [Rhamnusium bicolor]